MPSGPRAAPGFQLGLQPQPQSQRVARDANPRHPGHLARRGRGPGLLLQPDPAQPSPPSPWRDSSSSSANISSLRASILNSLRLINKHSFFNGEEKAPDFFFFFPEEIPQAPRLPAGQTLPARGCSNVCQVPPTSCFISCARVEQMLERFQLIEKQIRKFTINEYLCIFYMFNA